MQLMIQQEAVNGLLEMALDMQTDMTGMPDEETGFKTACAELTRETRRQKLVGARVLAKGLNIVNVSTRGEASWKNISLHGGNLVTGMLGGFLALPEQVVEEGEILMDRWTIGAAIVRSTCDPVQDGFICPVESCELVDLEPQVSEDFREDVDGVVYAENPSLIDLCRVMEGCVDQYQIAYLNSVSSPRLISKYVAPNRTIDYARSTPQLLHTGRVMYPVRPLDYFAMVQYQGWENYRFSIAQGVFTPEVRLLDLSGDIACIGADPGAEANSTLV